MFLNLNKVLVLVFVVVVFGGCVISKEKLFFYGDSMMMDIWQQNVGDGGGGVGQVVCR